MALTMSGSFASQIEALTGVTISATSTVTSDEITKFLKMGQKEVVSLVSKHKPQDLHLFANTTSTAITSTGLEVQSGVIVNVWRADGTTATNLNKCSQINGALKYRATDVDSLSYRSKINPAYYWEDRNIYILPTPSGTGVEQAVISYIEYDDIAYDTESITYLTEGYYPAITMYAAIKQLEAYMAFYVIIEEDIELASGIQANIATLKQQYQMMFQSAQQQGAEQPPGRTR